MSHTAARVSAGAAVLTWRGVADGERVADVVAHADTVGRVHGHAAICVNAAGAGAGVATLAVDTGELWGAVVVADALWATVGRGADVVWKTGAGRRPGGSDYA